MATNDVSVNDYLPKPTERHRWLEQLVGEWDITHDYVDESGNKATLRSTETVRSLDGIWYLTEGEGEMPGGGRSKYVVILGYDSDRQRFVGTWAGTPMTNQWIYDGELDESGRKLSLYSEGPSMDGSGGRMTSKDVYEIVSPDLRYLKGYAKKPDGSWEQFMSVEYRRKR